VLGDSLSRALVDPSAQLLLRGIVEVSEFASVALTLLSASDRGGGAAESVSTRFSHGLVDGVVVCNVDTSDSAVVALSDQGVAVVAIDSAPNSRISCVGIDDRRAGAEQLAHLLKLGHTRISVVTEPGTLDCNGVVPRELVESSRRGTIRDRILGYYDALTSAGLEPDSLIVHVAEGIDQGSGRRAAQAIFDWTDATAIAATSDVHATGIMSEASRRGIGVPDSLSVIGFDDAPFAAAIGLTTVRQPLVEKGRRAAMALLGMIEGRGVSTVVLPTEVVVRTSTGPPVRKHF
jgi:DNA-binding LacI/PurR family transcriptional regulator